MFEIKVNKEINESDWGIRTYFINKETKDFSTFKNNLCHVLRQDGSYSDNFKKGIFCLKSYNHFYCVGWSINFINKGNKKIICHRQGFGEEIKTNWLKRKSSSALEGQYDILKNKLILYPDTELSIYKFQEYEEFLFEEYNGR